jgi:hypothetical protein
MSSIQDDDSVGGRSDSEDSSSSERPRISSFWVFVILVLMLVILLIHVQSTLELFPYLVKANDFKGNYDPDATQVMHHFLCESLMPFIFLGFISVYMHDPTSNVGLVEISTTILGGVARCMLYLSRFKSGYQYMYLLDGVVFSVFTAFACRSRRKYIKLNFPPEKIRHFVFSVIPATIASTLTAFVFLFGETLACLKTKASPETELDEMIHCRDVVEANVKFSYVLGIVGASSVLIIPYLRSQYTMMNAVRFDFDFGEQAQIIVFGIAFFLATFIFASQQDTAYGPDTQALTSRRGRKALQTTLDLTLFIFVATTTLSQNMFQSASFLKFCLPCLGPLTARLRARMLTRSRARFSPFLRGVFVFITAVTLIPSFTSLVLAIVDDQQGATRGKHIYLSSLCPLVLLTLSLSSLLSPLSSLISPLSSLQLK